MIAMPKVYRMHFKPWNDNLKELKKSEYERVRVEIFKYFERYGFCGTGWFTHNLKAGMTEREVESTTHFTGSDLRNCCTICKINDGDYIWVNVAPLHSYYLFQVNANLTGETDLLKEIESKEKLENGYFNNNDIGCCFKGEWRKIEKSLVPEDICKFMRGQGMTFIEIKKSYELTKSLWDNI